MCNHLHPALSAANTMNPTREPHVEEHHGWDKHICSREDTRTDGVNDTTLHVLYMSVKEHLRWKLMQCKKPPKWVSVEDKKEGLRKRRQWDLGNLLLVLKRRYCEANLLLWIFYWIHNCIKGRPCVYYTAHPGLRPTPGQIMTLSRGGWMNEQ